MKNDCKFEEWPIKDIKESWSEDGSKKRILDLPKFQRSIVWKQKQREEFIQSLKNGFPVGSILLFRKGYVSGEEKDIIRFFIIDGLQRITTIKKYLKNPCDFFGIYDIDDKTINIIKACLYLENNENGDKILIEIIKNWINSLNGFELSDGYSGHHLLKIVKQKLSEDIGGKIINESSLEQHLNNLLTKIKNEANIDDILIPITIYSGPENNLPDIFERVNSKGTKLNRYEIYSASWMTYGFIELQNEDIARLIKLKYEKVIEDKWDVENYDGNIKECSYFEYIFGFGKLLSERYKNLFGESYESDSPDSCGFNMLSACLTGGIRKENLEKLPRILREYYRNEKLQTLENNVLSAVKVVYDKLNPIISIKSGKRKSENDVIKIAHSESQIISIIAKAFKLKYKDDGLSEKDDSKNIAKFNKFKENIEFHYLFDILNDSWRGSGDSYLSELLKNDKYETTISRDRWSMVLNNFFEKQLEKREKRRIGIKFSETILLNYIYSKYLSSHELGNKIFHLDHIIPVNDLSKLVEKDNLDGLPIGHMANICLISDKLNFKKGKKSAMNFYGEVIEKKDNATIEELDKQMLMKFDEENIIDLTEGSLTKNKYEQFLKSRFKIIKTIFFRKFDIK